MVGRIMELTRILGQAAPEEEELLNTLCGAAQQELNGLLRDGVELRDCQEAFVLAGAWLALAGLEVSRGAARPESFSAGDVAVRNADAAEKAKLLREQAKRMLSGWTKDSDFLFFGVRGTE